MTARSWLDDLEAAAARGAIGWVGVNRGYPFECACDICKYKFGNHKLDEETK